MGDRNFLFNAIERASNQGQWLRRLRAANDGAPGRGVAGLEPVAEELLLKNHLVEVSKRDRPCMSP